MPSNGEVAGLWWNELAPGQYVVQMQDLSLHFLLAPSQDAGRGSQLFWTREEGLSDLNQVEILEQATDNEVIYRDFDYIRTWGAQNDLATVPQRIAQRYIENFSYIAKKLFSLRQIDLQAASSILSGDLDTYGFKKIIVALSNSGKIFGIQSSDGSLLWTSDYLGPVAPQQILLRDAYSREDGTTQAQIVAIKQDSMAFLSASTGRQLFNIDLTKDLKKDQKFDKFMLVSLKETKSQLVLAISEDEEIPRVQAYPRADVPEQLDLEKEQLYFTSINKATGVLAGYQIAKDWQARKVW